MPPPRENSELSLIRLAISGHRPATERLLMAYYERLLRHIQGRLGGRPIDGVEAVEVLHETLVRALRGIRTFQPRADASFYAWLKSIADRYLIDLARRRARAPRRQRTGRGSERSESWASDLVAQLAATATPPSRIVRRRESERILLIAIAALPERCRRALRLHYLEGLSVDRIAGKLNCTPDAVRGLLHRGKQQLRTSLGNASQYSIPGS